jgi:NAD(P)-dependent dehydrogenase (short-subunit alcohol dehydrogenase family)
MERSQTVFRSDALAGRKILVTGASSGIGRATAGVLSRCGAELVLSGRDPLRLEETRDSLTSPGRHHVVPFEFGTLDESASTLSDVSRRYGAFNGVFHAAGISVVKRARLLGSRDLSKVFNPSIYAALAIAKVFSQRDALEAGASIVLMSSVAGHAGQQGMTLYSSSKGAIDALVRALASELAPRHIRVNSIAAGGVVSEMHAKLVNAASDDRVIDAYRDAHLLGFGAPQDVAAAATYLLSDASCWVTGTSLIVDGGFLAK